MLEPTAQPSSNTDAALTALTNAANNANTAVKIATPASRAPARDRGETLSNPRFRFKRETDRNYPNADQREVINVQRQIREISNELIRFQADFRIAQTNETQIDTKTIQTKLAALYNDIDLDIRDSSWTYQDQDTEKETPANDAAIYKDFAAINNIELRKAKVKLKNLGYDDRAEPERAKLNTGIQDTYFHLIKSRIKQTELVLVEAKSVNPILVVNSALAVLKQADITGDKLKLELQWHKERSSTANQTEEMQTLNALGKSIWAIDMDKLGMTNIEGGGTDIRQTTWIRPRAYIAKILDELKANDEDEALAIVDDLMKLYDNPQRQAFLNSTAKIKEQLQSLKTILENESLDPGDLKAEAKLVVETIQSMVQPPRQGHPIFKTISFGKKKGDKGAGMRSRVYILQGNVQDYQTVSRVIRYLGNLAGNKTNEDLDSVEDIPGILDIAIKEGRMGKEDLDIVKADIAQIIKWSEAGDVDQKQDLETALKDIPELLDKAYSLQKTNTRSAMIIYKHIANRLREANQGLRTRLKSLVRISKGTEAKINSLFIDFKDNDIKARAYEIARLFKEQDYDTAKAEIQEIRERYFAYLNPEPGYTRVRRTLSTIEDLIDDRVRKGYPAKNMTEKVHYLSDLIELDIEKKNNKRITVYDLSQNPAQARFVFPNQKINEGGLLKWQTQNSTNAGIRLKTESTQDKRNNTSTAELIDGAEYFISPNTIVGRTPQIDLKTRAEINLA
jgi:hypothetical protein